MSSPGRHRLFVYAVTIPFAVLLGFLFVWMAVTSLKPEYQVYDPTKVWSFHPTLASYGFLFHHTGYLRWLRNSCLVGLAVEGLAVEPLRALLPDLGADVRLRVDRPPPAPELLPEAGRRDLGRDVEPPGAQLGAAA